MTDTTMKRCPAPRERDDTGRAAARRPTAPRSLGLGSCRDSARRLLVADLLLLSACSSVPTLRQALAVVVPPAWNTATAGATKETERRWTNFKDLRLRETLANVDATRTGFYPTLSLTGSLGTASSALLSLLRNPVAILGAGLSLPFIQGNPTQLAIRVSETQYEEAVVNYRQRWYTALAEVEGSLSARTQLLAEEEQLRLATAQAQRAESIARTRYKAGVTDLQLWIDAQASLRNTERSLAANRLNQLNNQAGLYKALGLGAEAQRIRCR